MPEVETTRETDATSTEALQRKIIELQDRVRDLQHEAKDHRLKRNEYRKRVEDLESAKPADSPAELEQLRKENKQLKHRNTFERVARDAGARTSGKALDTLWSAIAYDAEGDADPDDLKAKIEAARADYDFLFNADPAGGETPAAGTPKPADDLNQLMGGNAKPETPAKPAGPGGVGRGAPADGAGTVRVKKSDLQSFDPRVNPMLDRHRAAQIEQAKRDGKFQYIDE